MCSSSGTLNEGKLNQRITDLELQLTLLLALPETGEETRLSELPGPASLIHPAGKKRLLSDRPSPESQVRQPVLGASSSSLRSPPY